MGIKRCVSTGSVIFLRLPFVVYVGSVLEAMCCNQETRRRIAPLLRYVEFQLLDADQGLLVRCAVAGNS